MNKEIKQLENQISELFVEKSNKYCSKIAKNEHDGGFLSCPNKGTEKVVSNLLELHMDFVGTVEGEENEETLISLLNEIKDKLNNY